MYSEAIDLLKNGKPVLIFDADDREGETDIVIPSEYITKDFLQIQQIPLLLPHGPYQKSL